MTCAGWRPPSHELSTMFRFVTAATALLVAALLPGGSAADPVASAPPWRTPIQVCLAPGSSLAYVVDQTADRVVELDLSARRVTREIPVGRHPTSAVLSPDAGTLYVSATWDKAVDVVDLAAGSVTRRIPAGHEPWGVALSADGATLYVAATLDDAVRVTDVASGHTDVVAVGRSPRFIAPTPDGRLVVTDGLGRGISIVDVAARREVEARSLDRASLLRQLVLSPDGRWAAVAHVVSHDETPTLQIERGWIHSNGISLLDLARPGHFVTLLLDRLVSGAANPWGMALSADGERLYVSLAGVHEVAIVDVPRAMALVEATSPDQVKRLSEDVEIVERLGIARRVPAGGLGPRGLVLDEVRGELLVPCAFSGTVTVLDAVSGEVRASIPVGEQPAPTPEREGEQLFNDARIGYQQWFSCASCHEEDGTMDGLNWDLPNDGVGNPKNAKSLHDAMDTPPAMWSGVRADGEAAVAAGQRFEGFLPDPSKHEALMAFLRVARQAPNPYAGEDPEAERRGREAFEKAVCDVCHVPPLFTDLMLHDLRFRNPTDVRDAFDTPSLRDVQRTGPYLHDGRAPTLRSLFTEHNPIDAHGRTSQLTPRELDDLVWYMRTL